MHTIEHTVPPLPPVMSLKEGRGTAPPLGVTIGPRANRVRPSSMARPQLYSRPWTGGAPHKPVGYAVHPLSSAHVLLCDRSSRSVLGECLGKG